MRTLLLACTTAAALGCTSGGSPGDPDGAAAADAAAGADAASADAAAPDGAANPDAEIGDCPAGQLCLDVVELDPNQVTPDGHLVVVYYQFIDAIQPLPVAVVVDRPFDGDATEVLLALADIPAPAPLDDFMLCPRSCFDLTNPACDCPAAQAKAALAFVGVVVDADASGAIEVAEVNVDANWYGVGYLQLALSDADYPVPNMLDGLFVEGILQGQHIYRIIDGEPFDQLGIAAEGARFDLNVCVPGACDALPQPNLT